MRQGGKGEKRFVSGEGEKGKEMEGREGLGMRGKWKEEIGSGREGEGGADSRCQYCSHRLHRLTALSIHHALTLSFHA